MVGPAILPLMSWAVAQRCPGPWTELDIGTQHNGRFAGGLLNQTFRSRLPVMSSFSASQVCSHSEVARAIQAMFAAAATDAAETSEANLRAVAPKAAERLCPAVLPMIPDDRFSDLPGSPLEEGPKVSFLALESRMSALRSCEMLTRVVAAYLRGVRRVHSVFDQRRSPNLG